MYKKKVDILRADGIKKNFVFQLSYQCVILIIPLVVSPYLTRTLGSTSLGVYTYTYSVAYYFVTLAMLGISKHGQRIIAQRKNNMIELRKTFWGLFFAHACSSIFAFGCYLFYTFCICNSDRTIAIVQSVYVLSALFDTTWLFYGLENFKIISIRNGVIKLIETLCIFLFVNKPEDIYIYTMIMCISVCLGHLVMIPQIILQIPPITFERKYVDENIKPLFTLFAGTIAVTLYTVIDKVLLGMMMNKEYVAFYEYSSKIITLPKTFNALISNVLFPSACRFASMKNIDGLKKNLNGALLFVYFISFGSFFGLFATADLFSVVYYGKEFAICGSVIISMCPLILIIGIGDAIRASFIYPMQKDTAMMRILFLNAAANLVISLLLIPSYGIYGAVIGTTAAELLGVILEIYLSKNYVSLISIIKPGIPFAVIGLAMYICIKGLDWLFDIHSAVGLVAECLIGAVVYMALLLGYAFAFDSELKEMIYDVLGKIRSKLGQAV